MGMCLEDVEAETEVENDGLANGVNLESREAATIPHSWQVTNPYMDERTCKIISITQYLIHSDKAE